MIKTTPLQTALIAALLGSNLQAWLQQPWVLGSFAALFVLLARTVTGLGLRATPRENLDGRGALT